MPASVQQEVWAENLNFVKNRDIYNNDYFQFISNLAAKNSVSIERHELRFNIYVLGIHIIIINFKLIWWKVKYYG